MKLTDINKENPFIVPDNYFDSFYVKLKNKIEKQEPKKLTFSISKSKITKFLKPVISIAAILLIVFILKLQTNQQSFDNQYYTEMSVDDIIYEEMISGMDIYSIYELMNEPYEEENFSEQIIDYLASNLSDYELLLALSE